MHVLTLQNDAIGLRIGEVVHCCAAAEGYLGPHAALRQQIHNVSTDSRTVGAGDLFIALKGERFDGHQFVAEAFARGAVAAVVRNDALPRLVRELPEAVFIGVPDTLAALGHIAQYHRRRFSLPVVAVTGSVGKTTSKELMAAVLARRYATLKSKKSFNNAIGVALTLLEIRPHHQAVVLEMGTNHFGEIAALCRMAEPEYGVILSIAEAHLEFFGTLEGVLRAKLEVFEGLVGERVGLYNADDPLLAAQRMPVNRTVTFGLEKQADVRGHFRGLDERGCARFVLKRNLVHLRIPGRHVVSNALAAAAVGLELGVPLREIKAGLEEVERVPERLEVIEVGGIRIVDDAYNSNLRSAKAALEFVREMPIPAGAKRLAVLADMLELGHASEAAHRRLGELVVENGIDVLLTFGEAAREVAKVAKDGGVQAEHFADKEALTRNLVGMLEEGDIVLVKGSRGMKMEEVVEGVRTRLRGKE